MPVRLSLLRPARSLPVRSLSSRPAIYHPSQQHQCRRLSDKSPKHPNEDVLPHVSEEAARTAEITGEEGPDIGQGTPVQEILKRDPDAQEKAPEVIKEEIDSSTSTQASMMSFDSEETEAERPGHKFGLPELPLPSNAHLKYRYDPIIEQVTNLMMRDGKKSVAQRNMSLILSHLRTSPPPTVTPTRPLLPGAPPPSHLPLNPIVYLTLAIDSVAPLLRIRNQKGAAGGGAALQIPVPLRVRQRRRKAMEWILDAASKRKSRGSGDGQFAQRVAEELIAVVEGRSGVWERRTAVHKMGISARANMGYGSQAFRRSR